MRGIARLRQLLRRKWSGYAPISALDRAQFDQDMLRPVPQQQYVMFFTPRSGSSRVADLLSRTKRMGRVTESFNPNFMPNMTRAMNAASLEDYCLMLERRMQKGRVAGFQITQPQLQVVFGNESRFLARYGHCPTIWLIRRDLILQAVSLYKMVTTGVSHSPHLSADALHHAAAGLIYDAAAICYWIDHLRNIERATEALIARLQETGAQAPLRLCYEDNAAAPAAACIRAIAAHIGVHLPQDLAFVSPHRKVGNDRNQQFAERFRSEHPALINQLERERATMLGKITPLPTPDAAPP